jgi:hypothetical protein
VTEPGAAARAAEDLNAWHILSPLMVQGGYLPWTTGSMRPAGLVEVCNEVVHGNRTRIVECGCGASTILLARLLRERQAGVLTSLEHDPHWAAVVQDQLRRESLDRNVRVVHAPLEGDPPWYRDEGWDAATREVDLLIVDGPPAFDPGHGTRRAPALSRFAARLVGDAAIILDDIDRPGEQQVIAQWEASTNWRFELNHAAGIGMGRRSVIPGVPAQ